MIPWIVVVLLPPAVFGVAMALDSWAEWWHMRRLHRLWDADTARGLWEASEGRSEALVLYLVAVFVLLGGAALWWLL